MLPRTSNITKKYLPVCNIMMFCRTEIGNSFIAIGKKKFFKVKVECMHAHCFIAACNLLPGVFSDLTYILDVIK